MDSDSALDNIRIIFYAQVVLQLMAIIWASIRLWNRKQADRIENENKNNT